ncbi:MAG: hypothetical protein QM610_04055 [Chitinophagaceae bacterium]
MSFIEKLAKLPNIALKLQDKVSKRHLHIYADYVELISVLSNKNFVTATDLLDRLKDEGIIFQVENDEDQAKDNDQNEAFAIQVFELLAYRKAIFGNDYPFVIQGNNRIQLELDKINDRKRIYIYLLLSSNLNIFTEFAPELTKEFEAFCEILLKNYLPAKATIKAFGKTSAYQGNAQEKIALLANDLHLDFKLKHFNDDNVLGNQERGLDLVGWIDFNDKINNYLIVMGQCACGKEWTKKTSETKRYEKYFDFDSTKPMHTMFIPYCLQHHNANNFFMSDEIGKSLIFERSRLLEYINDTTFFNNFQSKELVDKCLEFEEDIV